MALASSVTGAGNVVSSALYDRKYRVFSQSSGVLREYTETKTTVVTQWVAITQAAGDTWLAGERAAGESRRISEDNRVLGSYVAESTIETLTTTFSDVTP